MSAVATSRGTIFEANESSEHRAKLVEQALQPISKTKVRVSDGREIGSGGSRYSRILLDAPCTGLGALRRRPEARWRKSPSDLAELSKLQRDLFVASWDSLLQGGVLAYVTCSPHLSETTALVSWAEAKLGPELELLATNNILNGINPSLRLDESFNTAQLWPHLNGTDAMFIALFRKKVNS
jgi:16S rRNA (cytosine967-C5)-methyltransferase